MLHQMLFSTTLVYWTSDVFVIGVTRLKINLFAEPFYQNDRKIITSYRHEFPLLTSLLVSRPPFFLLLYAVLDILCSNLLGVLSVVSPIFICCVSKMPVLLLERLPLPSLEAYAVVSVSLLCWSLYYAAEKTLNPEWRMQFDLKNTSHEIPGTIQTILSRYWLSSRAQDVLSFSIQDSLCIWVSVLNIIFENIVNRFSGSC